MYKPLFNQVLIELDTDEDKWGTGNDDSMLGRDYNRGKVIDAGPVFATADYPIMPGNIADMVGDLLQKDVMFNKGHEAGKTFEDDGKLYAFVNWWDIVGVNPNEA